MQPVLPTSLDMASARVLGFDATAYINDTKSTLNQRLNIPGAFALGDCYAFTSKSNKKKNKNIGTILAGVTTFAAATLLCVGKLKGKIKGKLKIGKFNNPILNLAKSARKTFSSAFKKLKKVK